jgi:transcriptional regulator with GAF, ATPase, and Fis domain
MFWCCIKNDDIAKQKRETRLMNFLDTCLNEPINIHILGGIIMDTYMYLTGSKHSIIYLYRKKIDKYYLEPFAISDNIFWTTAPYDFYHIFGDDKTIVLQNINTLFRLVVSEKNVVISNKIHIGTHDTRVIKSPTMHNFLGMPIFYNHEIVGIIGLINKKGNFSMNDTKELENLNKHIGNVLWKYRNSTSIE